MAKIPHRVENANDEWHEVQPVYVVGQGAADADGGISGYQGGAVVLTGASQEIIAEGDSTGDVIVYNPVGNHTITLNLTGAAAVVGQGLPIEPGGYANLDGIVTALTAIGTDDETIIVYYR